MTAPPWRAPVAFRPGGSGHDVGDFDCGRPELNRWLRRYAGQGQRRDAARTYVVVDTDERVIAYYTLVAAELKTAAATVGVAKGLSKHFPIPAVRLARLAVDRRHQGGGLGAAMLADAFESVLRTAERVGTRAVVVDAIDDEAAAFYRRFGLEALSADGLELMVPVATLRRAASDDDGPEATVAEPGEDDATDEADLDIEEHWYTTFALLGARGLRPRFDGGGLMARGPNGDAVAIREERLEPDDDAGELVTRLHLVGPEGAMEEAAVLVQPTPEELVLAAYELMVASGPALPVTTTDGDTDGTGLAELERQKVAMAYVAYRPELEALAVIGIHAHLETSSHGGLRLVCGLGDGLRLDISIMDDPLPASGPGAGYWLVLLESDDGLIAEFGVERDGERAEDAMRLVRAVRDALQKVLRGGSILFGEVDERTGRVDEGLYRSG